MRIGKRICLLIALITPFLLARSAYCQTQNVSWVDCFGSWSNGSNWSGGIAPNNISATTYNVTIDRPVSQCGSSFVAADLDQNVTVNSLTLGFGDFLVARNSTPDTFTILSGFNSGGGGIEFFNGSTLIVDGPYVGGGTFQFGGRLISRGLTINGNQFSAGAPNLIVGPGSEVDARGGTFTNLNSLTGTLDGSGAGNFTVFDIGGTLRFDPGTGPYGGNIINIAPDVVLLLDGGQVLYGPGAGTNALTHLSSNAGFFDFAGILDVSGSLNNSGHLGIGFFDNSGSITVNGNFTNSGAVSIGVFGGSPMTGSLESHSYTQNSLGTTNIFQTGTLTADTIDIQGGLSLAGTINGNLTIEANGHETGDGTINGNLTNFGTFARTGIVTGDVLNASLLAEGAKVGTLKIGGNYTQTTAGTLSEMLSSPSSFDRVDVSGLAFIGGTLAITTHFNPFGGETLTILDASSLSGQFSTIVGDHFGGPNDFWNVVYTPTSVELVAATPEPGTLVLLGIGFLGLAGLMRRKALPPRQIEI